MTFFNIKLLLFFLVAQQLAHAAENNTFSSIDKKYTDFYQVFYKQKNEEDKNTIQRYKAQWKKEKDKKQRIYDYLGLIDFELSMNDVALAEASLQEMPAGLKYFTAEQKQIYDLIRAKIFFVKNDYASVILLLKSSAFDENQVYFNMTSALYLKSLVALNLKFEAINYFERYSNLLITILNWDDYNSLAVEISSFLIDLQQNEKAFVYLKKPLLYFPLYHSGNMAMQLLTKIECSGNTIGEQFHNKKNSSILDDQIFNRIAFNEYAKNFVLAMVDIDEANLIPL
ncbi:MAG: hypothetical protein V4591_11520, partial [Bdellovibrionota bacterium]